MAQEYIMIGNKLLGLVEGPEGTISIDDKGMTKATMVYTTQRDNALTLAMAQTRHPYLNDLVRHSIEIAYEAPCWAKVTLGFEGVVTGESTSEPSSTVKYELQANAGSEPVETHPDFPEFGGHAESKGVEHTNAKGAIFDKHGKFIGFAIEDPDTPGMKYYGGDKNRNLGGVKSYLAPTTNYVETKTFNGAARKAMAMETVLLGRIETPPPSSLLPKLPDGSDWLYVGYDVTESGEGVQIKRSWKASGPRGWNRTLYKQGLEV